MKRYFAIQAHRKDAINGINYNIIGHDLNTLESEDYPKSISRWINDKTAIRVFFFSDNGQVFNRNINSGTHHIRRPRTPIVNSLLSSISEYNLKLRAKKLNKI
jgi:hypothetical protein